MDAIELLTTRSSMPRVTAPGPTAEQLEFIQAAALRAPDHAHLMPYQFWIYQDAGLQQLSEIFTTAANRRGLTPEQQQQAAELPLRAPCVIAACLDYKPHEKVPRVEQISTVACALMAMQQAAFALGLGGVWRTGWFAQDEHVKAALGCGVDDEVVGFLYLGTPSVPTPIKPAKSPEQVFHIID